MAVGHRTVPLTPWTCRQANGGYHTDARALRIDVSVIGLPAPQDEVSWTCDYVVLLICHDWLAEVRDLIDDARIGLGELRMDGMPVSGWSTIHERGPPPLLSTEGSSRVCPTCGNSYSVLHGREYFADPAVLGRPLIVNRNGLFVREDIARSRKLRTPRGAFEPGIVAFEGPGAKH